MRRSPFILTFILATVVLLITACGDSDPTPTPTRPPDQVTAATATPAATPTVTATDTPIPTQTPLPTSTPTPTATRTPTPTATPTAAETANNIPSYVEIAIWGEDTVGGTSSQSLSPSSRGRGNSWKKLPGIHRVGWVVLVLS